MTIVHVRDECGREVVGDTCGERTMRRRMAECTTALGCVSLGNGCAIRAIADLTDAEIGLAIQHVEAGDDDLREAIHAQGHDNDRAYLAAYCREHERLYGSVWMLP